MLPEQQEVGMSKARLRFSVIASVFTLILAGSVWPAGAGYLCAGERAPAATLLVPFFRVDLDEPNGETTLVSIANAGSDPVLAHVIVWTDWAEPVLGFYAGLPADGAKSINLRDVVALKLPTSPAEFPGCAEATPGISAEQVRARLAGQLDPVDGERYSSEREGNQAVGFLTVDVVHRCEAARGQDITPFDSGYFGPEGVAGSANVLWGDVLFIDPDGDSASGSPAVAVPADADRAAKVGYFYKYVESDRPRLPKTVRARFMNGGPLATTTSLLVWLGSWTFDGHRVYGDGNYLFEVSNQFRVGPESGPFLDQGSKPVPAVAFEAPITAFGDDLPQFGTIELSGRVLDIDFIFPEQLVVWPVYAADGRFSAAQDAVSVDPSCWDETRSMGTTADP